MRRKFPKVLAGLTILLVLAGIVVMFVGGITQIKGLWELGMFFVIIIPMFSWVMLAIYKRVHADEDLILQMQEEQEKANAAKAASKEPADETARETAADDAETK